MMRKIGEFIGKYIISIIIIKVVMMVVDFAYEVIKILRNKKQVGAEEK